jgi:hypothetical protein
MELVRQPFDSDGEPIYDEPKNEDRKRHGTPLFHLDSEKKKFLKQLGSPSPSPSLNVTKCGSAERILKWREIAEGSASNCT